MNQISIKITDNMDDVDKCWDIKREIHKNSGLLRQDKNFFYRLAYLGEVHVVTKDEEIIAFSILDNTYLALLGVYPEYQGMGIGSELVEHMKNKMDTLECHTRVSNKTAKSFYIDHSFEIVNTESNYYANGEDAYRLQLKE